MTDRIIDISDEPADLSIRNANLIINSPSAGEVPVPLIDIAVVVASNPCIRLTHAVLSSLAEFGCAFISCDTKHLPAAMLLPIQQHFKQAGHFMHQVEAKQPVKKRLWQEVVKAKVLAQARLLELRNKDDCGLKVLASKVRSGDPDNIEAQAARKYWPAVFKDPEFQRIPQSGGANGVLDYGYAILRAITARALCGAGLHPSIGIHHHNKLDAFCLADDVMEPSRPIVDLAVAGIVAEFGPGTFLDKQTKQKLLLTLTGRFLANGEWRSLFDWMTKTAFSLANVFSGKSHSLEIPEIADVRANS